ncbi:hypothetical protein QYF36_024951 [Acer negundo]|nr:hypothetical protein QYF36_024951 [Acer negundo]
MSAIGNPIEKDNVQVGNPLPGGRAIVVEIQELQQAHHYVLQNTIEVQSYIEQDSGVTVVATGDANCKCKGQKSSIWRNVIMWSNQRDIGTRLPPYVQDFSV